jgi:hypothetical protein
VHNEIVPETSSEKRMMVYYRMMRACKMQLFQKKGWCGWPVLVHDASFHDVFE